MHIKYSEPYGQYAIAGNPYAGVIGPEGACAKQDPYAGEYALQQAVAANPMSEAAEEFAELSKAQALVGNLLATLENRLAVVCRPANRGSQEAGIAPPTPETSPFVHELRGQVETARRTAAQISEILNTLTI